MMNVIPRRSPKRGFQHGFQNLRMPSFAHYLLDSTQSLISYSLVLSRAARSTTLDSRAMLCPTTAIPTLGCNRCHCFTLYNMLPTVDGMYHSVERSKAWAGAGSQCWTGSSVPQQAVARVIRVVWKSNHGTRRSGGLGQQCLIVDIPRFCDMRGWRAPHDATAKTSIPAISHTEMRCTEREPEQGAVSTANPSMAPVMQCRGAEPEG